MKKLLILILLIPTFSLFAANIEINEENLKNKLGEVRFKSLDDKIRKFLSGTSLVEIEAYLEKEAKSVGLGYSFHNGQCNCQRFRFFAQDWENSIKLVLKTFPDFHEKKELKSKHVFMAKALAKTFDLEKDLKRWPDLLSNTEEFNSRIQEKIEQPMLYALRTNQNEDGSYGDKNKLYCSSIALLAFLSRGETSTSRYYGKNVQLLINYLSKPSVKVTKLNINVYTWALAESYIMLSMPNIEKQLNNTIPTFLKHENWDYKTKPGEFLIRSLAIYLVQHAITDKTPTLPYFNTLKTLKDKDSFFLLTAKVLWYEQRVLNSAMKLRLSKEFPKLQVSPFKDIAFYFLSCRMSTQNKMDSQLSAKLRNYEQQDSKYIFDSTQFSHKEIQIMTKIFPQFLFSYFHYHYLPSTKIFLKDQEFIKGIYKFEFKTNP